MERLRVNEEKRLAEILKKQQAFNTAASLATFDQSANVDPAVTDIKQRAMAKAAALSKKMGTVVFNLLLDQAAEQLSTEDRVLFQKQLASGELVDVQSTSICTPEHEYYGMRGDKPYFKPAGWIRCGLGNVPTHCEDWCIAYHGTTNSNALRILLHGLKRPGEAGVSVAHGQVHSQSGASIYVSPSIEYAAFPCYSQLFKLGEEHWAQLVLECKVRPTSFKEAPGTLSSNKHWPNDVSIDGNFAGLSGLEWLLERESDVVVSALMIREFGQSADTTIFGDLVAKVKSPEFLWSELRVQQARADPSRHTSEGC